MAAIVGKPISDLGSISLALHNRRQQRRGSKSGRDDGRARKEIREESSSKKPGRWQGPQEIIEESLSETTLHSRPSIALV